MESISPKQEEPIQISTDDMEMGGNHANLACLTKRLVENDGFISYRFITPEGEPVRLRLTNTESGGIMIRFWVGERLGPGNMILIKESDKNNNEVLRNIIPLGAVRARLRQIFD